MKKFLAVLFWFFSLIIAIIYTYENPEKFDVIKNHFKKYTTSKIKVEKGPTQIVKSNSFYVKFSKIISLNAKTAFIVHEAKNSTFNENNLVIYTQNGYVIKNSKSEKLNLPDFFTIEKNGGIKTIFIHEENEFALISSLKEKCFYASIILLNNSKEVFKTKCLPDEKIDYNGLGSSNIHYNNKIIMSIGAPEQISHKIAQLAQKDKSFFGKIIEIEKDDLNKVLLNEKNSLTPKIFTKGNRNPQGLTKIDDSIFSVEHGPRGGDELNIILKNKNYGWPIASYGAKYSFDKSNHSYEVSHENNDFEEPLFALVPSVGISAVSKCPAKLNKYYKKPCLLALSLYGNELRPGRSIIIYLLNKEKNKIHSIEKIFLRDDLKLRHFVTNSRNELYEDKNGSIYISADMKGIYRLSFINFIN
tara:strand:+ start:821 stop:2068 length:1248 start_codon:yes stop_codon:yes gene_type:complete